MDIAETALVRASRRHAAQADGSVEGYRATRTLPVRVELARQLRRRRTRLALGFLAVLPFLLLLAFEIGDDGSRGGRTLADMATASGLNFTVFTLFASTNFLLVVVVALFFGDTVASEASWSSLKYLLAAPIPRIRLLRQKAVVSALLSGFGLLLLAAVALGVGLLWYGSGELVSTTGEAVPFLTGVLSVALATVYLAVHLTWIAGLALWLSVSTDAPLGAVGGAVVVSILSEILDQITALGELRSYLPTHYSTAYSDLLSEDIDWTAMTHGAFAALAYATVFTALAIWRFHRKDITS
ncbi:ABC transporter permease subunit [Saccharopolyspora sp. 5N708]|uniref:ABC transporter permease subunit n=1 Tax=Saccharopolyspora sp. 5N708 TaxID=3457424 RepID=UPI003FCF8B79